MSSRKEAFFGLETGLQNNDGDDMEDLMEEEVWGEESLLGQRKGLVKEKNGGGESYRRSKLSVEMHSATVFDVGRTGVSAMASKARNINSLTESVKSSIPHASTGEGYGNNYGKQHAEASDVPQSAPVMASYWANNASKIEEEKEEEETIDGYGDDDEDEVLKLPPHEFLARQYAKNKVMAYSVFEGVGRTLKGMDLRRVRNAVWRQTGFLD